MINVVGKMPATVELAFMGGIATNDHIWRIEGNVKGV
jgi:hypothetical protein